MGINQLNKFICSKCKKNAITHIDLSDLQGKTIVIDTSIYMYKYAKENYIIEGMFKMISTLLYYNIKPIFVFDGKPPAEKEHLLVERREKKKDAELKYNSLKEKLTMLGKSKTDIEKNKYLQKLKKDCTKLKWYNIVDIKEMMNLFGVKYLVAEEEADKLCCSLVISGYAWACLSEDTDMFVYGCPRILRYISFMTNKVVLYDLYNILKILDISQDVLIQICVLTGTDYNNGINDIYNLYKDYKYYKKHKISAPFYSWIKKIYLCSADEIEKYTNICKMFSVMPYNNNENEINSIEKKPDFENLQKFLLAYDFIFINNN